MKDNKFAKKANQVEAGESDSDVMPLNNLVEIFSLSSDEFSGSLDAVLAAKTKKLAP